MTIMDRPFMKLYWFLIPFIACMLWMGNYFPQQKVMPPQVFIISFEFVQTPAQVQTILEVLSPQELVDLDAGNKIDFVFMLAYASFLFGWFWVAKNSLQAPRAIVGMVLSVAALLFDALENWQLLQLTSFFTAEAPSNEFIPVIGYLQVFTWAKWLSLALAMGFAAKILWKEKTWFKYLAIPLALPVLLAVWGLSHEVLAVHYFTLSISLGFLLLFISCFRKTGNA